MVDSSPYNIWLSWGAEQRDLFFLNSNGDYITDFNISTWNYDVVYSQITSMIESDNSLNIQSHPDEFSLFHAYPNPFNPSTNISFFIFHGSQCKLSVYDINGSYLETLLQSYLQSGSYTLAWNAADYAGGIYFIKLDTDFNTHSQKLTLIK